MKPFASRYLLVAAFSLFLAACSSAPVEQADAPAQADAWQQLQQNIASIHGLQILNHHCAEVFAPL